MSITSDIGIMQGRLSPKIDGKIQAFPWEYWINEFKLAKDIGFTSIEWIVEEPLEFNPLLTVKGINLIQELINDTEIKIDFICVDYFMKYPIFNSELNFVDSKEILTKIISAGEKIGAKYVEIPFVDNSSIRNKNFHYLIEFFNSFENILENNKMNINLETDLSPVQFKKFLNNLNFRVGANYDIGNSASLGYNFIEEIACYGERIQNVHIKDRIYGGNTVPFGQGDANIFSTLNALSDLNYNNGLIIQGARGDDDVETAKSQLEYVNEILKVINNEK